MAEYIDREVLIENLERFAWEHYNINAPLLAQLITKQPAADVVEVRRGEWVKKLLFVMHNDDVFAYTCSICGKESGTPYNYCPHCGADMRGEGDGKAV